MDQKPEQKEEPQQPPAEENVEEKPAEEAPKETQPAEPSQAIIVYNPEPAHQSSNPIKGAGSWLRDYMTAVKTGRFHPFTKTERKARAATRNQSHGPSGTELNELARLSHNAVDNSIIFGVIEFRLGYPPHKWRNVYKALTVLEFLIKRGSEDAVTRAKSTMPMRLELLGRFAYIAPDGRDVGDNVRHRALAIDNLLKDDEKLKAERALAAKKQMASGHITAPAAPQDGDQAEQQQQGKIPPVQSSKNISAEDNRKRVAALKQLLARPENKLCADCANPGVGSRPTWASVSCGVFLCLRCAGAHRSLGTHISQVRSISLDTWSSAQVAFLAGCGGNTAANAYWEALLPEGGKPASTSGTDLEAFVRRKYADKAYALPDGVWPPEEPFEDDEIAEILDSILSEEERAAKLAAAEAEEAEAANTDILTAEEAREAAEGDESAAVDGEEQAETAVENEQVTEEEAPLPPAPLPDLINLMDFDIEPTPIDGAADAQENGDITAADSQHQQQQENDIDPLAALESMFIEPKPENPDPFAVAQPPSNLNAWDMGAVLQTKQQESDIAAANSLQEQQQLQQPNGVGHPPQMTPPPPAYLPPWAPQPHVMFPQGMPPPSDAAMTFTAGFSAVPNQFTAAPVLPPPPFAFSTGSNNAAVGNPFADSPGMNGSGPTPPMMQSPMPWQQQQYYQNMQPHELKAQNVMLGGLDSLVTHAGLVTVKQQQSPLGPVVSHVGSMKSMKDGGSPGTSPGVNIQQNGGLNGGSSGFQVQF